MIPTAVFGVLLSGLVTLVAGKLWGSQAAFAAAVFGALATAIFDDLD